MDNNLDKIALDLYGKIQTRFSDIKMGDENAAVLSKKVDIPRARFFEFEYTEDDKPLGTITITLDKDDGVVVQVSGDLVDDESDTTHHNAYKFIRSFRKFAKNRLLNFDVQNIGKSNLDKRDYQFQAKPKEQMMENKMFGTSRISYQDLGEARLIVKHTQPINPELAAGRTMHIECIYIENADGERFKYPYKHLPGARALAEHIKHGGIPYDDIGKHITKLSEELASLRKFKGYVSRQSQISEAMGDVTSRVIERIDAVKKEIVSLQRPAYYQQFAESFTATEDRVIPETVMNDWIERLTVRTFNEEMKSVFPFLYNIVDESELPVCELSSDYFLDEKAPNGWEGTVKAMKKHKEIDNPWALAHSMKNKGYKSHKESFDPEYEFESFIESIMHEDKDELFGPNLKAREVAIGKLNDLLAQPLLNGAYGEGAAEELDGLIHDEAFFSSLKDVDPDLDIRAILQTYLLQRDPELALQLKFGSDDKSTTDTSTAPGAPMPTAGAPMPDAGAPPADLGGGMGGIGGGMPPDLGGMPPEGEEPPAAPGEEPPAAPGEEPLAAPGEEPLAAPVAEGINHKKSKIKAKFIKAKAAGATLETMFADGMTIRDALRESGITPDEAGYSEFDIDEDNKEGGEPEEENISGVNQILRSIVGFWNAEERNFTVGGTRAKIIIKKNYEDGEYSNASDDDVKYVMQKVNKLDPSSDDQEQTDVLRLAGLGTQEPDDENDDGQTIDMLMKELQGYGRHRKFDSIDKHKIQKTMRNNYDKNFRNRASKFR